MFIFIAITVVLMIIGAICFIGDAKEIDKQEESKREQKELWKRRRQEHLTYHERMEERRLRARGLRRGQVEDDIVDDSLNALTTFAIVNSMMNDDYTDYHDNGGDLFRYDLDNSPSSYSSSSSSDYSSSDYDSGSSFDSGGGCDF